jgi:dipeptidase E
VEKKESLAAESEENSAVFRRAFPFSCSFPFSARSGYWHCHSFSPCWLFPGCGNCSRRGQEKELKRKNTGALFFSFIFDKVMKKGHIIALGSGRNLIYDPFHPFHEYLFSLTGKKRPRIGFLPTATGDSSEYIVSFYEMYGKHDCQASHLALFHRRERDLGDWFTQQDILFVGGGNTANMLAVWRLHGIDQLLRQFLLQDKVVFGGSAGGLCWFEGGITDSFGIFDLAPLLDGLGFLEGSFCPHFDSDAMRKPLYKQALRQGSLSPGYALDDFAALHFYEGKLEGSFSLAPGSQAFFYNEKGEGKVIQAEKFYSQF